MISPESLKALTEAGAYLGVPYRLHGADMSGWDCLGLVKVMRRDIFGLATPYGVGFYSTADADDPAARARLFEEGLPAWERCERCPGAVALFNIMGRPAHVGLMLTKGVFIHARDESTGTVIENLSGAWARRLVGCFDAR